MTLVLGMVEFGWVSMIVAYLAATSHLIADAAWARAARWPWPLLLVLIPLTVLLINLGG